MLFFYPNISSDTPMDIVSDDSIALSSSVHAKPGSSSDANKLKQAIWLDRVDQTLAINPGLIQRPRDTRFCRHGENGMCDYCSPLEPYDLNSINEWLYKLKQEYKRNLTGNTAESESESGQKESIKYLSAHSYLRKLIKPSSSKSKVAKAEGLVEPLDVVLETPSFKVNPHCDSGHAPYPEAMCAKCQPSAIVLMQQSFRMVDHVEFESPRLIDDFLSYWRQSGLQRFGWLYGKYVPYCMDGNAIYHNSKKVSSGATELEIHGVPLGMKAVVSFIYEPKQHNGVDGIELDDSREALDEEADVETFAKLLGMRRVGMIYTDLEDAGTGDGKVICKRHADSFFLSSAEIIFIAHQQNLHPYYTAYAKKAPGQRSPDPSELSSQYDPASLSRLGTFGSKLVSVVVSGDKNGDIHLSAYQVSNTCMGMVRDSVIDATMDPTKMKVVPSTKKKYVPEVFYKYRNEYGRLVQEAAQPYYPVEYHIVTLTEGFPQSPSPWFSTPSQFPIENRIGQSPEYQPADHTNLLALKQHFASLKQQSSNSSKTVADILNDFHLMLFLKRSECIGDADVWAQLVKLVALDYANAALADNESLKSKYLKEIETSESVMNLLASLEHMEPAGSGSSTGNDAAAEGWSCKHCTFHNETSSSDCQMCGLPRN